LKILSGLLLDSVPLFGTRRRHYMLFSALGASVLWLMVAVLPPSYVATLTICTAINVLLVLASSAGGALFAEAGQRLGAIDRLAMVRILVDSSNSVVAGSLAGWLAIVPFVAFAMVGAVIPLTLIPVVLILVKEPPLAKYEASAFRSAWLSVRAVVSSREAWAAAVFLCLVSAPQSFLSMLYLHQTKTLNFQYTTIGYLDSLSGIGGISATVLYWYLREKQSLRTWLILGIACGCADPFIYLYYQSIEAAVTIHLVHGVLVTLTVLAMLEVAGRATPQSATALGFAFIASAWNFGIPLGDILATRLRGAGFGFYEVMAIYSAATPLTFAALFVLPRAILGDGARPASAGHV
jgi:hypothetical protein